MIHVRRVKLLWGASHVIRGRWYFGLFGFYDREEGCREDGLAISVRGALAWLALVLAIAWLAGAGVVYARWHRNPHNLLTYSDAAAFPWRRAAIAEKHGQAFIAEGLDLWRREQWPEAAARLARGLELCPAESRARLALADCQERVNRWADALQTLRAGLTAEFPGRAYVETFIACAARGEDYALTAETCARYLVRLRSAGATPDAAWLAEQRFVALMAAGRAVEALALAEAEESGMPAREHRVAALLALGRVSEATGVLNEWRQQPDADRARIARWEIRALAEARRYDAMEAALTQVRAARPDDPATLAFAIEQLALSGRGAAARAAAEEFCSRFGDTAPNLSLLAATLAKVNDAPSLARVVATAAGHGLPSLQFRLLWIDALLRDGDWTGAKLALQGIGAESGRDALATPQWRAWAQRLLDCAQAPAGGATTALLDVLRGSTWPIGIYYQTIDVLRRSERFEAARDVAAVGRQAFPASERLRRAAADVALEILARKEALPAELAPAGRRVTAGQIYTRHLEDLMRAQKWDDAVRHIVQAQTQRPVPAWLDAKEPEIRLAQVRIARGQRDLLAMLTAARLFLNGDDQRSQQLLELARAFFAEGDRANAVALAREIVRRSPAFSVATLSLVEWESTGIENVVAVEVSPVPKIEKPPERTVESALPGPEQVLRRVRDTQARGERLEMIAAARVYLNGDRDRALALLAVAQDVDRTGDRAAAVTLVNEVLRRTAGFPPAVRLLKQWGLAETK